MKYYFTLKIVYRAILYATETPKNKLLNSVKGTANYK